MTAPVSQYSTAKPFFSKTGPVNITAAADVERIQAYDFYENAYYNRPETMKVVLRGDDDDEQVAMFLPSTKKIIEATNRFLAVDFNYSIDPSGTGDVEKLNLLMKNLFKRERMYTKFANQKRYGLIRGDVLWHIIADDTKLEGERISIYELDPRTYFPIEDPQDSNRIAGCHIVDIVQDPRKKDDKSKKVARRQTYRRTFVEGPLGIQYTGEITSELILFELGKWDDRNLEPKDIKQVQVIRPATPLPAQITSLPVYHWKNNEIPGAPFGNSEVAGIETLINGINQSITDQDLTLVMQGLGMYWTNAGPPQDEAGNDVDWQIGPKTVVEVGDGQQFGRVTGVSTVAPYLEHIKFIDDYANQASGIPDIAAGRVDVAVAESGISLALQLMPILAKNAEKELEILGITDQMLYDISTKWFAAYEGWSNVDTYPSAVVGSPMPDNREASINELLGLVSNIPQIITLRMVQEKLEKYGYTFTEADLAELQAAQAAQAAAMDPFAGDIAAGGEEPAGDGDPADENAVE